MKIKSITVAVMAFSAIAAVSTKGAVLVGDSPVTLDFDNLNSNFGGAYNATGGSSAFPASTTSGTAPITIYSGASVAQFTVSTNDFNPGGVYSNTGTYSNSNSVRALRDGTSSDYAIGVKDSTDRFFVLTVQNDTGMTIPTWDIAYDVEQYSTGASATIFSFQYSLNGTTYVTTNLTGGANVVATTSSGSDGNLSTVLSAGRTASVEEEVVQGGQIFFRWTYDHQGGTSSHIGLDNITITAIPEPSAALLGGLGLLALLRRRLSFSGCSVHRRPAIP